MVILSACSSDDDNDNVTTPPPDSPPMPGTTLAATADSVTEALSGQLENSEKIGR